MVSRGPQFGWQRMREWFAWAYYNYRRWNGDYLLMRQWMHEWLVWAHGREHNYGTKLLHGLIRVWKANRRWFAMAAFKRMVTCD